MRDDEMRGLPAYHAMCAPCNRRAYTIITTCHTHIHTLPPPVDLVSAEQGDAEITQIRAQR